MSKPQMIPFKENSVNLITLFVILGPIIGVILTIFLWVARTGKNRANLYLGFLTLQFAVYLFPCFLYVFGLLNSFPHFIKISLLGAFLVGPFTYFYVRSSTQKGFEFRSKMWLHFIPALLDLIYHAPYYILPGDKKIEYFINFFVGQSFTEPLFLQVIKVFHVLIYCIISIRIVLKYKDHLTNASSYIDSAFHRWLIIFCSALMIPVLSAVLFTFFGKQGSISISFLLFTPFAFVMAVFSLVLFKPSLFMVFPHQMLIPESTEEKTQKYESSNLQNTQKEKYLKILLHHIEKEKSFLEPELTLAQLSEQTKIPSHYLSQVINEKIHCNFLDFINKYRIQEAKAKLANRKFDHYTIIAIAFEAGFNSKTTFYSAFKKHVGTTPSAYRKSLKAS